MLLFPGVPLLLQRSLGGGRGSDGRLEFRDALALARRQQAHLVRHKLADVAELYLAHLLHEQGDDASEWVDVSASPMAYDLWLDAFEDGCVELKRMVRDENIGPRSPGEDEDAPPVGPLADGD